jgi:hypothetical protein
MLVLGEADARHLLPAAGLVDAREPALGSLSSGAATQPVRRAVPVGPQDSLLGVMPAYILLSPCCVRGFSRSSPEM